MHTLELFLDHLSVISAFGYPAVLLFGLLAKFVGGHLLRNLTDRDDVRGRLFLRSAEYVANVDLPDPTEAHDQEKH